MWDDERGGRLSEADELWDDSSGLTRRPPRVRILLVAINDRGRARELIREGERCGIPIAFTTDLTELRAVLEHEPETVCILDQDFAREGLGVDTSGRGLFWTAMVDLEQGTRTPRRVHRAVTPRALPELLGKCMVRSPDAADRTILGVSMPSVRLREDLRRVALYPDVSVLVLGATGTGKELVAQTIHALTRGPSEPFVAVNCAALPEQLVESELFGHEAGAFTGARQARVGLMEAARAGTLFLDEIGEMPLSLQTKLLRALETRSFRPVGSNRVVPLQARIVSATNRMAGPGQTSLREDLYYRLAGFSVRLPSLRRRLVDVPVLARHFLRQFEARYGVVCVEVTDDAMDVLEQHPWPGNCRELRTVIEHAAIAAAGDRIGASHVRAAIASRIAVRASSLPPPVAAPAAFAPTPMRLEDMERAMIERALAECGGNVSRAAHRLGVPRSTLRDKIRRYQLG